MIKRARRLPDSPDSNKNRMLHELTAAPDSLRLRTWVLQNENVNKPGDGIVGGGNIIGDDFAPRLAGMVFAPTGDVTVPWDGARMRDGAVFYLNTLNDGTPPPAPYAFMEVDEMAAPCPASVRAQAQYPHWDHKLHVLVFHFQQHILEALGVGFMTAVKIISDGDGSDGFTGQGTIIEARCGALGFVGAFDHTVPGNAVDYRDARTHLPDGTGNPAYGRFPSAMTAMPVGWELG